MTTQRLTALVFGLVVAVALAGCSSGASAPWNGSTASCDPCAPAPNPCDPCAPPPSDPCSPCATPAPTPCGPSGQLPANANPGEVWCYVRIPAVTKTVSEQICIQPETCRQEWVPPVTKTVQEQVCVKPEERRKIPIPARYETVCEQVMVCASRTEWQRVNCEPKSLSCGEQLGECWSLVEIPAVYETRQKQVCISPESCREEIIPAVYETRCKEVTVQEGYNKSIPIPAQYETQCREVEVCPARWEWRRTTECEVPCAPVGGAMAPAPDAYGAADAYGSPDMGAYPAPDATAPMGSPDAYPGTDPLPPADAFAPR